MAVVAPEARLHWIVVTYQRCQVAGLARASCGAATCIAETVGVARWMHGAPPMESVETLRGIGPQTGTCRLLLDPQNSTFPLCRAAIFVVDVPSYRHGQLLVLPRRPYRSPRVVPSYRHGQLPFLPRRPYRSPRRRLQQPQWVCSGPRRA